MSAIRNDEKLWERIKKKMLKENDGKWSARLAQQAVKKYKDAGGTYSKKVKKTDTSLHKWTEEKWDYIGKPKKSRYLPEKVAKKLTKTEIKRENALKGNKLGKNVSYSKSVNKKMKEAGIF